MLSIEERNRRYDAIRQLMSANTFDCLIIAGRDGLGCRGNIRYVTNYGVNFGEQFCCFPISEKPIFLGSHISVNQVSKAGWISEFLETEDASRQVIDEVRRFDRGNYLGIIGLTSITVPVYIRLKEAFSNRLRDATWLFKRIRLVKSSEEIEEITRAVDIADQAYEGIRSSIRPGISDFEIYGEVKKIVHERGCEYSMEFIDTQGSNIDFFNPVGNVVSANGTVALEITPAYHGYYGQLAVTIPIDDYPSHIRGLLPVWREALESGVKVLKPGSRFCDVYGQVMAVIQAQGYASYLRCGHAIGLDPIDFCSFNENDETEIASGMTVALHPCVALPNGEGIGMGYTYLISDGGPVKLNKVEL